MGGFEKSGELLSAKFYQFHVFEQLGDGFFGDVAFEWLDVRIALEEGKPDDSPGAGEFMFRSSGKASRSCAESGDVGEEKCEIGME